MEPIESEMVKSFYSDMQEKKKKENINSWIKTRKNFNSFSLISYSLAPISFALSSQSIDADLGLRRSPQKSTHISQLVKSCGVCQKREECNQNMVKEDSGHMNDPTTVYWLKEKKIGFNYFQDWRLESVPEAWKRLSWHNLFFP